MPSIEELREELKAANRSGYSHFVYLLLRPNGQPFYVGKGTYWVGRRIQRPHQHIAYVKWGQASNNRLKDNVIAKILREHGDVPVSIDSVHASEDSAFDHEKLLIAHFGRRADGTGILCNFTPGGEGVVGVKHTPETRRKASEARRRFLATDAGRACLEKHAARLRGKKQSEEHKRKAAASRIGRVCSEETRRKIGLSNSKHSPSPEVRKRIAATLTGRKQSPETKWRRAVARGHVLTFNGETKVIREWADAIGVRTTTIRRRLRIGWSMTDALQTPSLRGGRS